MENSRAVDVLCVGHASYDLVFAVPCHPGPDDKLFATSFMGCGGGPAANAAVTVARLGRRAAFAGYLGEDVYGDLHLREFQREGVDAGLVVRGPAPTPLSAVLVKPDGSRSLVNYKAGTAQLPPGSVDFSSFAPSVVLFDGHEPGLSRTLAGQAGAASVLDAGSLHAGTEALMFTVGYLVCSEKFASQWLGENDPDRALRALAERSPAVVVTLGERGLVWQKGGESGRLPAFPIRAVDTTGAGDVFHGAFAAALAMNLDWPATLRFASAAGALCCEVQGARPGAPGLARLESFLDAAGA